MTMIIRVSFLISVLVVTTAVSATTKTAAFTLESPPTFSHSIKEQQQQRKRRRQQQQQQLVGGEQEQLGRRRQQLSPAFVPSSSSWTRLYSSTQEQEQETTRSTTIPKTNHNDDETNDDDDDDVVELAYTIYSDGRISTSQGKNNHPDKTTTTHAVLFLHGLLGNQRNFASIATALSSPSSTSSGGDTNYLYYTLDLRNHGQTRPWKRNMSYTAMARDVWHFIQQHELPKVTLVGHSMGAKVAQTVALFYGNGGGNGDQKKGSVANVIQGLVVLDMAPVSYSRQDDAHWATVCGVVDLLLDTTQQLRQQSQSEQSITKRTLDQALRPHLPDPALRAFCLTNWNDTQHDWKVPLSTIQHQLPELASFPTSTTSSSSSSSSFDYYKDDVLLVHGGQSRFVRSSHLPTIQTYFPNHMITTLRGAGHWLHAEQPETIISLLQQYLNR